MKKILTHLTGIVLLITILVAAGCSPAAAPLEKGPEKVIITLKAVKIKGVKHLEMYDSNNPDIIVVDALETLVYPGDTVVWEIISSWRLKKVLRIGGETPGMIIDKDAEPINGTKSFMFIIPVNAPYDTVAKYDINCKGWIGKAWPIDPYLRIPPGAGTP